MAARLPIIMVQTRPPTAAAQQRAEQIVGELIGINGIDLTLVDPLPSLAENSTDWLTLSAVSGDVAVLDWKSQDQLLSELANVGFQGQRSLHEHDRDAPPAAAGSRRIYAFDLTRFGSAADLISALERLLSSRQVRTFSLGLVATPGTAQNSPSPPNARPQPIQSRPQTEMPLAETNKRPAGGADVDLDALLDQLDQIDP